MAGRIQKGERRILNGKTVFADGNGNWTSGYSIFNLKGGGKKVGTYDTSVDPRRNDFAELNGERVVADGKGNWITPYSNRPGTTKGGQVRGSYGDAPSQPYKHNSDYTNQEVRDNKASVDAMTAKLKQDQPELFRQDGGDPPPRTGDEDTRVIPGSNGATQTGRQLGKINMPGLEEFSRYAGADIANFAGPSFPTQPSTNKLSANYQNTNSTFNIQDQGLNIADSAGASEAIAMEGNKFNASNFRDMGGNYADFSKDNYKMGGKFHGAPTPTEGLADPNKRGTQIDEDMEFGGPDPMGYATSGEEMRRRAAFLNADNSIDGIKAVQAGLGYQTIGGDAYYNVNGEMIKGDRREASKIQNAAPGKAQALKDAYVTSLTSAKSEEQIAGTSPAALQAPDVDTSLSTGSAQNQLRPEAFNEDGPNFGISPTTQPINIQKPQETQDINVGKDKNKVNAANFTGGASPFGTFNATKFNL